VSACAVPRLRHWRSCDPERRRKALKSALAEVEYRRELLAGLDAVRARWIPR
jgi:hypothetical protein